MSAAPARRIDITEPAAGWTVAEARQAARAALDQLEASVISDALERSMTPAQFIERLEDLLARVERRPGLVTIYLDTRQVDRIDVADITRLAADLADFVRQREAERDA